MHSNVSRARLHWPNAQNPSRNTLVAPISFRTVASHPHDRVALCVCIEPAKWNRIDPLIPIIASLSMLIPHDNKEPRFFFVIVVVVVAVVRFS